MVSFLLRDIIGPPPFLAARVSVSSAMFSGDAYWLELLLQSKNASMFTAKERSRFGHLLSETDHFKETLISVESRRKVG